MSLSAVVMKSISYVTLSRIMLHIIYIYIYIYIIYNIAQSRWMLYNLYISAASCLRQERTNKAKQKNFFEIVQHPTTLSYN